MMDRKPGTNIDKTSKNNYLRTTEKQLGPYNPKPAPAKVDLYEDPAAKITREGEPELSREEKKIYRQALQALNQGNVSYAVGATFARHAYTGIWRKTKDLDVFLLPQDLKSAMDTLREAGFDTEVAAKHWLAKAYKGDYFVDLIFGNAHGHHPIDERSFEGSQPAEVLGVPTRLIPIEEMIVSIGYVAERRRFDGGEVVHLIKCSEGKLDWDRIVDRLAEDRELLLWHLILFDFVYPGHSDYLPKELMAHLFKEVQQRWKKRVKDRKIFRGALLDPFLFAVDIEDWGYDDLRNLEPIVDKRGKPL